MSLIKKYKCMNIGNCEYANAKKIIEIAEGEEVKCPKCGSTMLIEMKGASKKTLGIVIGAVVGVAVIGGGAFALLGGSDSKDATVVLDQHNKVIQIEEVQYDTLRAEVTPAGTELVWTSSNEDALTVKDGVVTIISEGGEQAVIYVQAKGSEAKDSCVYELENQFGDGGIGIETFVIQNKSLSLAVGSKENIICDPEPMDAEEGYSFTSSDESVATVAPDGVVTAKKAGKAVITVACDCGDAKAKITVEVKDKAQAGGNGGNGGKGGVNLGYGRYTGDSRGGQPHGNGTIEFTSAHVIPGTKVMAQPGEKVVGSFRDGAINMGTLYMNNGNEKIVKLGSQ